MQSELPVSFPAIGGSDGDLVLKLFAMDFPFKLVDSLTLTAATATRHVVRRSRITETLRSFFKNSHFMLAAHAGPRLVWRPILNVLSSA
jgi:hypothetical protein